VSVKNASIAQSASVMPVVEATLTIGALAKASGVTVRTVRYYEEMDLIGPIKRSDSKYRLYNSRSLKRVKAIVALQGLNYTLDQILDMMGPYSESTNYTKAQRIDATRASLQTQRAHVAQKMLSLQHIQQEIDGRLATLDVVCQPCLQTTPHQGCDETCAYRDTHLN